MELIDRRIVATAKHRGRRLVTRAEVLTAGGSDVFIAHRLARGWWTQVHAGVYLIGIGPLTFAESALAATLAGGPTAVASCRSAMVLWSMDGLGSAPVEITVVETTNCFAKGTVVHRSRRLEAACWVSGVPTTSPERTLLESGAVVPPVVTERAFASAWRMGLTTPEKCLLYCESRGGKGRTGTVRLRMVASQYADGQRAPGSVAEVDLFRLLAAHLPDHGIELPARQHDVPLPDGSVAVVDGAWPMRMKVIEMESLRWHGDIRSHDYDVYREAQIRAAGYDLRRVTPRAIRERPEQTIAMLLAFLRSA